MERPPRRGQLSCAAYGGSLQLAWCGYRAFMCVLRWFVMHLPGTNNPEIMQEQAVSSMNFRAGTVTPKEIWHVMSHGLPIMKWRSWCRKQQAESGWLSPWVCCCGCSHPCPHLLKVSEMQIRSHTLSYSLTLILPHMPLPQQTTISHLQPSTSHLIHLAPSMCSLFIWRIHTLPFPCQRKRPRQITWAG